MFCGFFPHGGGEQRAHEGVEYDSFQLFLPPKDLASHVTRMTACEVPNGWVGLSDDFSSAMVVFIVPLDTVGFVQDVGLTPLLMPSHNNRIVTPVLTTVDEDPRIRNSAKTKRIEKKNRSAPKTTILKAWNKVQVQGKKTRSRVLKVYCHRP